MGSSSPPRDLSAGSAPVTAGPVSADELLARWPAARRFVVVGAACVVAGGITAAVTRPTGFELGSWLAAYLVLVGGVAQIALGAGQVWIAAEPPGRRVLTVEIVAWNVGVLGTIVGTLVGAPVVTTLGGIATVVALVTFLLAVRDPADRTAVVGTLYRWVAAIVAIGVPVGLALSWIRRG